MKLLLKHLLIIRDSYKKADFSKELKKKKIRLSRNPVWKNVKMASKLRSHLTRFLWRVLDPTDLLIWPDFNAVNHSFHLENDTRVPTSQDLSYLESSQRSWSTTVWKNAKFTLIEEIFRKINSLVISLVKTLISRKICQKRVRVNFYNFHTVSTTVWKFKKISIVQILCEIVFV